MKRGTRARLCRAALSGAAGRKGGRMTTTSAHPLQAEICAFEGRPSELEKMHLGKFVVSKGDEFGHWPRQVRIRNS